MAGDKTLRVWPDTTHGLSFYSTLKQTRIDKPNTAVYDEIRDQLRR